jgi:hypothetical protein
MVFEFDQGKIDFWDRNGLPERLTGATDPMELKSNKKVMEMRI